jgi:hypothetical protein
MLEYGAFIQSDAPEFRNVELKASVMMNAAKKARLDKFEISNTPFLEIDP